MNIVALLAIPEEAPDLAHLPHVFFTGVGKVNAAITTTEIIFKYRPRLIVNFGTAGGITVSTGFYQCTRFVQRDMLCESLGFSPGQTPFELETYLGQGLGMTCSSGDNFVMNPKLHLSADIVDMEAYAIAKACARYQIDFVCWKYISDQANHEANVDWRQQVSQGQKHYASKLQELELL